MGHLGFFVPVFEYLHFIALHTFLFSVNHFVVFTTLALGLFKLAD